VSEALHTYEIKLMLLDNAYTKLANAALNPTKRKVYYMHNEWRKYNYGPIHEPLPKLKEKTEFYNNLGMNFIKVELIRFQNIGTQFYESILFRSRYQN